MYSYQDAPAPLINRLLSVGFLWYYFFPSSHLYVLKCLAVINSWTTQFQIYHGHQIMKYSILNLSWLSTHETYKSKYIMEYICCQINCDIRLDSCSAISRHPHTSYRCHTVPPSQALPSPSCSLHNRYQYLRVLLHTILAPVLDTVYWISFITLRRLAVRSFHMW